MSFKQKQPLIVHDSLHEENIEQTTLANGLTVLTQHVPAVKSISLGLWVENGSRDETKSLNGISHFIEHTVFKGTKKRNYIQINESLERVGGYLNAFTSKEQTCFYARCLSEHLKLSVDVLCDITFKPTFPDDELEKEKDVIIEEIKSVEDSPEEQIFDDFDAYLFNNHALGLPITGSEESVDHLSREQVLSFLKQNYVPNKTLLVAAGQIKHADVVKLAGKYIPKRHAKINTQREHYPMDAYSPFEKSISKPIHQSHIVLGFPFQRQDEDYFSLILLNALFGGGMSSRLNMILREKYGLVYSVYSNIVTFDEINTFSVYAGTDKSNIKKTLKIIREEFSKLCQKNISQKELNMAKAQLLGGIIMGQESLSKRQNQLARDHFYFGRILPQQEVLDRIHQISIRDIRNLSQRLFKPESFSTLIFAPKKR